jgi:hypothetical protein
MQDANQRHRRRGNQNKVDRKNHHRLPQVGDDRRCLKLPFSSATFSSFFSALVSRSFMKPL